MEQYTPHAQFSNLLLKPICLVVSVYYSGLLPFLSCEGCMREVVNVWTLSGHTSILIGGYCTTVLLVWLYCCIHMHNSLHVPCLHARAGAVVVVVGLLCAGSNVQMPSRVCMRERAGVVSFRHILQVQNNKLPWTQFIYTILIVLPSQKLWPHGLALAFQLLGWAKSRCRPSVWPGLAQPILAQLGPADGLRPGQAHHYSQSTFPFDVPNICSLRAPSFWHATHLLPGSMGRWKGSVRACPVLLGPTVHMQLPLSFLYWLSHPIFSLLALCQDLPPFPGMDVAFGRFMPIYIPRRQHNTACSCLHLVSMQTLICFITGGIGVPFVWWFGTECDYNTMVLDLLRPSCAP